MTGGPVCILAAVRRVVLLAVAAFVLALAGTAAAAGTPSDTVRQQDTLIRAGKFQALYQLYSPKFRAKCPYGKWVKAAPAARKALQGVTLKVIGYQVSQGGDQAFVSYKYLQGSKVVYSTTTDLYVLVHGKWLDELDKGTSC